jgi:hypothetical protein
MAGRQYGLADRIEELGQDPQAAYAAAKAAGDPVGAFAPTQLPGSPAAIDPLERDQATAPPAPADPDAALHRAQPGKEKPAAPVNLGGTGTLADTVEEKPDLRPVRPTMAPLEDVPTFGQTFEASRRMMRADRSDFAEITIRDGYAPIVRALGLRESENPARFYSLDPAAEARFGSLGQPSDLATAAKQGESTPFGSTYLATRDLQERLIVDQLRQRRAKDPNFLKGVPDTVDGLHAYFLEQEKAQRAGAAAVVTRSQGLSGALAQLSGGAVETFHDPVNLMTLPIGGGGKTFVQIAAREALVQGMIELAQQPQVAANRESIGEKLTLGEAAANVGTAALGGAVLGSAFHAAGHALTATGAPQAAAKLTGAATAKIREAITALAGHGMQIELNPRVPIDQALGELDNRQLVALHREMAGDHSTPDERAAANVLERATEIGDTSPYQAGPAGTAAHETSLAQSIKDLETPEPADFPSVAAGDGAGAATPAAVTERPPAALSTARRPQPITDAGGVESFIAKTRHVESRGNDGAKNPKSSAEGRFQITDGTFRNYYKRLYGQDPGEHPARELKLDVDVQERIMHALTADNAAILGHVGEGVNDGNLYLMHFLGAGDGPKVFRADPSTPIERLVGENVLEANPFLRGKSASQVIAWAHEKMGGAVASVEPRAGAGALDAGSDDPMVAQLNAEALQLEQTAIGSPLERRAPAHVWPQLPGELDPGRRRSVPVQGRRR